MSRVCTWRTQGDRRGEDERAGRSDDQDGHRAGHTRPRLRFTWKASDPGVITWRNEMAAADGSWFLIEEYEMVPA
jgi:hypothetical protein